MPPGQEQVVIIVDVSTVTGVSRIAMLIRAQYASATSQSNPSIGTARHVLGILQNHYVERASHFVLAQAPRADFIGMGRAIVVRMPYVFISDFNLTPH